MIAFQLACLLLLSATAASMTVSAAELRGRVLDALDGRPLPAAEVQVAGAEMSSPKAVRTGADGTFALSGLAPGEYRANVSKSSYEARRQRTESFRIAAENERVSITVRLRPSPVIAGRVLDSRGEPASGAAVELRQWRSSGGVRVLHPVEADRADDLGAFRLFDLRPGAYFLLAKPPPAASGSGGVLYDLTARYYPGVAAAASAGPIELDWGRVFEQADVELEAAPQTVLTGSALAAGAPCDKCRVMLEADESGFQVGLQPDEDGGFRVFGLPQGSYRALARNRGVGVAFGRFQQSRTRPAELLLDLSKGVTIHGSLELENPPEQSSAAAEDEARPNRRRNRRQGLRLTRIPPLYGERYESQADDEDGFVLEGVPAGDYLATPSGMPPGGYAAEVLAGGAPLQDWRLRVPPGAAEIEAVIRVAFDGGAISGGLRAGSEVGYEEVVVVLLPVDYGGGQGFELYSGLSGEAGAFAFDGVPPGAYELGAVRRRVRFDWADPAWRTRFASQAARIRVGPRSSQRIEAPLVESLR